MLATSVPAIPYLNLSTGIKDMPPINTPDITPALPPLQGDLHPKPLNLLGPPGTNLK